MSELTPELAPEILAACQANGVEAAGALSRALGSEFQLEVGESGTYSADALTEELSGPGLGVQFQFGEVAMVAILPESSNMLPVWYNQPDPTGESQLSTLAQEFSMLLVPETMMADGFEARKLSNCLQALKSGGAAEGAAYLPLKFTAAKESGVLHLVWPITQPANFFPTQVEEVADQPNPAPVQASTPAKGSSRPTTFMHLPGYSRSLLKVQVPVRVVLATKKESVDDVVEIAPGTIIKFDKPCDEMLQLFVGNQQVAEGEAVKVGDKFGFRVNSMVLPKEHFLRVRNNH